MDQCIIAALKKWDKYLYLKDALKFSELHEDEEKRQCDAETKGAAAHLLDAALYVGESWKEVMSMTINNCFAKADLGITLEYDDMEIDETDNFNMTDLMTETNNIMTK
jgi:hypothetical protein